MFNLSEGKVVRVRGSQIESVNLKMTQTEHLKDGERVSEFAKDLGNVELFPQSVKFNFNGQLFAICGESDYVIYTSRGFKNTGNPPF